MNHSEFGLQRFFRLVTAKPIVTVLVSFVFIISAGSQLPKLHKDTTAEAFINPDNPALIERDKVEEIFGLKDPVAVALVAEDEDGVFKGQSLRLLAYLTEEISGLNNIDPERVTSLATENMIVGTQDGIIVEAFFEEDGDYFDSPPLSDARGAQIKAAVDDFPLYQGSLVARNGQATLIVAELLDESQSEATYDEILAIIDAAEIPLGMQVHVAGEGAISGYLSTYIDQDASRLNPMAAIIITIILGLAFVAVRGAILPNFIVLGTVASTIGIMAGSGVSFYVITNGLVVNLIGMAVADAIHIFSQYYEERQKDQTMSRRDVVIRSMVAMWRPVTLTTVTTMAGFLALAISSEMPPGIYFGVFGAVGVFLAWAFSMTLLPALMTLWPSDRTPLPFKAGGKKTSGGLPAKLMTGYGRVILRYPLVAIGLGAIIMVTGILGATKIITNDVRIENFNTDELIYKADKAINAVMDGTYYLDVIVEAENLQDLYRPEFLKRIEALQAFMETLPNVNGTTSIVDYVKQLHRAVNENDPEAYIVPDNENLIAQLFFLYNASADPTDFEEEVDGDYQRALVRANLNLGEYLNNLKVIPQLERYLETEFNTDGLTGKATGEVNVSYHWIDSVDRSNSFSVALSFAAVLSVAIFVFRSFIGGVIAVFPVAMAVLLVYAVMGFGGIYLGVGTSMFSAIAIGLSIDFAIHTLDRIRDLVREGGFSDESLLKLYPTTGRALLFNFLAVGLGFGVLMTSQVPPLVKFGSLVAVAVTSAFLASLSLLPALVKVLKPRFLQKDMDSGAAAIPAPAVTMLILGVVASVALMNVTSAEAEELDGRAIMQMIKDRPDGDQVTRDLTLELIDKRGKTRIEKTTGFRKYYGDEKRTIIFYTEPTHVRGTGFLTFDYPDVEKDDDQWLYLPALRKVRRISASDRGDYFLGTDFTYEEIKKEQKVELSDYEFTRLDDVTIDGRQLHVVEGVPVNSRVSKELGYSKVIWRVDPSIWMSRSSDYYDRNGNHLKTITLEKVEEIDGIQTATQSFVQNHKTGHATRLKFDHVDYQSDVSDTVFSQRRLRRGS